MVERRAEIDSHSRELLRVLLESAAPVSGRRVADVLNISPTTASKRLRTLHDQGLVNAQPSGPAVLWSANEASAEVRAFRRELESSVRASGSSALVPADALAWVVPVPGPRPTRKAVVLTALGLEYAAVRSHLTEMALRRTRSGTRFDVGVVHGENLDWDVYLAEVGMGNACAAAEVAGAIEAFSPDLIVFVGVAGGLKPSDQGHGDVVVASMVHNVHSVKLARHPGGSAQVLSRPIAVRVTHRLAQLVIAVSRTAWIAGLPGAALRDRELAQPAVHLKPIVAGELVLADPGSDLRLFIAQQYSDAAAIDMESYGVYETAYRYDIPVLAVRGLSDLIGDKNPDADREWQPRAVANAAAFAVALLCRAEEDDVPPGSSGGGGTPGHPTAPREGWGAVGKVPTAEESLARVAPGLRPWWRRLRARRGGMADLAIADLAGRAASSASWLGRIRHRPPTWLRDDDHGDAWALVAWFAESHDSPHATRLFDRAADRADQNGDDLIAGLHKLQAARTAIRHPSESQNGADDEPASGGPESARVHALRRLSDHSLLVFGPVTAVVRAAVSDDNDAVLASAPAAMSALGLPAQGLIGVDHLIGDQNSGNEANVQAGAVFAELAETDPDIVDQLRSDLLLIAGYALLMRSEADPALAAFAKAREYAPGLTSPLLGMARGRLQRADLARTATEVSADLAQAEELALLARDRRRTWSVGSGEPVAIAVRARAGQDPIGALRLALPAPRGVATDAEARSPEVREAGAVAAIFAGEHQLAVELASGVRDPVERDLIRAAALAEMPNVGDEVEQALRRALRSASTRRPDQLLRALMALVQLGAPVLPDQPGTVAQELGQLRNTDAEAADMVEASAALHSGQLQHALVITRQYPTSTLAVEIAAKAAAASGDREEAFRILERAGTARADETLRTQAMIQAADAGLDDQAQQVATQLVLSRDAETRRHALEVQLDLAGRAGRWHKVAELGRRLLEDDTFDLSDARRDQHLIQYRWAVAGAEFNLRRPERARKVLDEPDILEPRNPLEALLMLAVLRAATVPHAQDDAPARPAPSQAILERAFAAASAFPDDEDVVAGVLKLALTGTGPEPLPDTQLVHLRALQEQFFDRFPDSTHLRRITVGDDLSGLAEEVQAIFAPNAEQILEFARQTWLGICPQALLADVTNRSYAETLIKRTVGCLAASTIDPVITDMEQAAARASYQAVSVVIDTSALEVLDHLGKHARRLMAQYARVLLPASHRDDILEARNGLALRSTATLGWNPQQQRPQVTEIPPDVAGRWAESGARLAQRITSVEVVPQGKRDWSWDDSLLLASQKQSALWADDLALRHAARSKGVPAFGTLDLVTDLVNERQLTQSVLNEVVEAFQHAYIVDLPLARQLLNLAAKDGWKPDGYAALYLARPCFWSQPSDGFAQFMQLMRAVPSNVATPKSDVGWATAAMTGIAWAIPPPARPRAVAGILAWTVLNGNGAEIFPTALEAGENVMAAAAPAGDLLGHTISVLTETLCRIVPTDQVGAIFTRLLVNFDGERRTQAMQSFLSIPR